MALPAPDHRRGIFLPTTNNTENKMSAELKDFRGKITAETDAALEAINRVSGRDKSEIVRDILHKWASEQIHVATVLDRMLQAEGLRGIVGGTSGNRREDKGKPGRKAA